MGASFCYFTDYYQPELFMKLTLILLSCFLLLLSCGKDNEKKPIQFRLNGRLYVLDSLESTRNYFFTLDVGQRFFKAYNSKMDVVLMFTCDNQADTTQIGKYVATRTPVSLGIPKRISYFNLYISNPSDPNAGMYDSLQGNFAVNFNQIADKVVSLDFAGTVRGGKIMIGGFTPLCCINRADFEITDGRINGRFTGW